MGTEGGESVPPGLLRRVLIGRNPKNTLLRAAFWVLLCVLISQFVLLPIRVQGVSMLPTYRENGVNAVNHLAYLFHPPRRGDVVAIRYAGKHIMLLKRVVALPGETIRFHQGRVFINGELLDEPYVQYRCNWEHEEEVVGPDEYYVVGDNRSMDFNDHTQGRAERKRIMGKVLL
jgi:signal peptidase I